MKKEIICEECGGLGYYEFYLDDENELIQQTCDMCMGERVCVINVDTCLVYLADGRLVVLEIRRTVNRPNNPSINEIIYTYCNYHYGESPMGFTEIDDMDFIDKDWNVVNHE